MGPVHEMVSTNESEKQKPVTLTDKCQVEKCPLKFDESSINVD